MIRIVNKHTASGTDLHRGVYIGRGSALSNPYKIQPHGKFQRDESLELYREHLLTQVEIGNPAVLDMLYDIAARADGGEEVVLVCFCHPHPCHGDIIKEVIETQFKPVIS